MAPMQFTKAVRRQLKARIALIAPAGCGKTYSALRLARGLVGPTGSIGVIDTERSSALLYAGEAPDDGPAFDFEHLPLDEHAPRLYIAALKLAADAGLDCVIVDSLSHAWMGKGGALEQVDKAAKDSRSGSSFNAWRDITPQHNALVAAMLSYPGHVIVTLRAKSAFVQEKDEKTGRTTVRRVGMEAIQRDGLEFEFTIVGDMTQRNELLITKTRWRGVEIGQVIERPDERLAADFAAWLNSAEAAAVLEDTPASPDVVRPALPRASTANGANGATPAAATAATPNGTETPPVASSATPGYAMPAGKYRGQNIRKVPTESLLAALEYYRDRTDAHWMAWCDAVALELDDRAEADAKDKEEGTVAAAEPIEVVRGADVTIDAVLAEAGERAAAHHDDAVAPAEPDEPEAARPTTRAPRSRRSSVAGSTPTAAATTSNGARTTAAARRAAAVLSDEHEHEPDPAHGEPGEGEDGRDDVAGEFPMGGGY